MAATDAQRQANSLLVHGYMNQALNAGIQGQPPNTTKTYRKPQRDFQVSRPSSCSVQRLTCVVKTGLVPAQQVRRRHPSLRGEGGELAAG